jgi:serine/threonine-protein kinase
MRVTVDRVTARRRRSLSGILNWDTVSAWKAALPTLKEFSMSDDFAPGQRLGDYEILGVLGAGGMGKVYKVRNVISDRVEAMKVLLASLAGQKDLADRFLREIKLLAALNHPNIAPLYSALTLNDRLVMLMEYIDGVTLAARLQSGPIPPADAINYSEQILSALGYAHKMNVIHRDVKPSNMMLTPHGVVKLMDFGIARPNNELGMTLTGTTLGSLNYMSPEQVRGSEVDARSDLYSFGVSLYEMVTGQLPFQGHSNYSVMSAHVQQAPPPPINLRPYLPKGLNEIILMAMTKDPNDRFQSAEAFANALNSILRSAAPSLRKPITASAAAAALSAVGPAQVPTEPATGAAAAGTSPVSSGPRGLYMALGGVLVVAMLAGASLYVPHYRRAHASSPNAQPSTEPVAQPRSAGDQPINSAPDVPAEPTAAPVAAPQPQAAPPPLEPHQDDAAAKAQVDAAREAQQQAEQNAAQLREAVHQADLLDARAASLSQSLDTLRNEQARQGYGLRGDMSAAEQLMKTNLAHAQDAISQGDAAQAEEYLDIAAAQAEKLEHFLGR